MKVRYKGSLVKDEVQIDVKATIQYYGADSKVRVIKALEKLFGAGIEEDNILKVKFWVYKKKKSWISCNGVAINFEYNLVRLLKDSENDHYQLSFLVEYHPAMRGMRHYTVRVGQDCYPKKVIIKHLIHALLD